MKASKAQIRKVIKKMSKKYKNGQILVSRIVNEFGDDTIRAGQIIDVMQMEGELFYPRNGYLQKLKGGLGKNTPMDEENMMWVKHKNSKVCICGPPCESCGYRKRHRPDPNTLFIWEPCPIHG